MVNKPVGATRTKEHEIYCQDRLLEFFGFNYMSEFIGRDLGCCLSTSTPGRHFLYRGPIKAAHFVNPTEGALQLRLTWLWTWRVVANGATLEKKEQETPAPIFIPLAEFPLFSRRRETVVFFRNGEFSGDQGFDIPVLPGLLRFCIYMPSDHVPKFYAGGEQWNRKFQSLLTPP